MQVKGKSDKVVLTLFWVIAFGLFGTFTWAFRYAGMFKFPWEQQAQQAAPTTASKPSAASIDEFRGAIAQIDSSSSIIAGIAMGRTDGEVAITVQNVWHDQSYQNRLQVAQNLQRAWAKTYAPNDPDKARIRLLDLNGNEVGGSSFLAGSLVDVKK